MAQKPVKKPGQPGTAGAPIGGVQQPMATTLGAQPGSAQGRPTGTLGGDSIQNLQA